MREIPRLDCLGLIEAALVTVEVLPYAWIPRLDCLGLIEARRSSVLLLVVPMSAGLIPRLDCLGLIKATLKPGFLLGTCVGRQRCAGAGGFETRPYIGCSVPAAQIPSVLSG